MRGVIFKASGETETSLVNDVPPPTIGRRRMRDNDQTPNVCVLLGDLGSGAFAKDLGYTGTFSVWNWSANNARKRDVLPRKAVGVPVSTILLPSNTTIRSARSTVDSL